MEAMLNDKSKLIPALVVAIAIAVGSTLIILLTGGPDSGGGSSASQAPAASGAPSAGSGDAVEIVGFAFAPEAITVATGTTVTFTNSDDAPHTATADDDSFDTGDLNKGDAGMVTFDTPGTIPYICTIHPFMQGEIVVE